MMVYLKSKRAAAGFEPQRRWPGQPVTARAHEADGGDPGAAGDAGADAGNDARIVDPNTQQIVDARGNAAGAEIPADRVARANASAATENAYAQTLSDFVVGQQDEEYQPLIDFLAPTVQAPFLFRYRVKNVANAFAVMENTGFGVNGRPQAIRLDKDSSVLGQLQSHGLMSWLTRDELDLSSADPQWGQDNEVESVTMDLRNMDLRGTLLRILSLFATSAGAAESLTWDAETNPVDAMRTNIKNVADEYGTRAGVRVVWGSDAWELFANHALIRGTGTEYPMQAVSMARAAELLGIPEGNMRVSYHQALTTKQGKTAAKSDAFTASQIYIYGASQNPSRNDNTFVKRFRGPYNGQDLWAFRYGISDGSDPFRENFGFVYRELLSATNSSAVERLTVAAE